MARRRKAKYPLAKLTGRWNGKIGMRLTRLHTHTSLGSKRLDEIRPQPWMPIEEPTMSGKRKFKSAAVQELYDELVGAGPSAQEEFEQELVNIEVAQLIHDMRTKAGLSQRELARKVGTSASAINRLESGDYQGNTVAMVRRIATALNRRLELRAVPIRKKVYEH
jgi:DNA-binding XRE family transcriptional regulator